MFERFTERATQVVVLAQEEAREMKHGYIGSEHIFLGLIREETGLACRVLESLGIGDIHVVRAHIRARVGEGEEVPTFQAPFTPRAKKSLEMALREALSLGHNYIGTEHILLGLMRTSDGGWVAGYMNDQSVTVTQVRDEFFRMLSGRPASGEAIDLLPWPSDLQVRATNYLEDTGKVLSLLERQDHIPLSELVDALNNVGVSTRVLREALESQAKDVRLHPRP